MARVRSFALSSQEIRPHPTTVECEHRLIGAGDERLLHLSTFGSSSRQSERKSSQSLQFDLAMARELVDIIVESFPEIKHP